MSRSTLAACVFVLLSVSVGAFDPFDQGKYKVKTVTINPLFDGSPLRSPIYYPDSKEAFQPIFFVGGLGGIESAETYSNYLTQVAGQGYVVIGLDRVPIGENTEDLWGIKRSKRSLDAVDIFTQEGVAAEDPTEYADIFLKQIDWVKGYLNSHKNIIQVKWNQTILMCHVAGCDVTLNLFLKDQNIGKAAIFLDPLSITVRLIHKFPAKVPAFITQGNFGEFYPFCAIRGLGYRRFYDIMPCRKVKYDIKSFGTCALADDKVWEVCKKTNICHVGQKDYLPAYRNFIRGTVVAFLRWNLDGDKSLKKYVVEKPYIKLPLKQFAANLRRC